MSELIDVSKGQKNKGFQRIQVHLTGNYKVSQINDQRGFASQCPRKI